MLLAVGWCLAFIGLNEERIASHALLTMALQGLLPVVLLYLVWKLARLVFFGLRFAIGRHAARKHEAEATEPVSWLVERPSFSPSRIEAARCLPDYSARLLMAGTQGDSVTPH